MKDPDIVWAIEIEQDWVIDTPSLETEWDQGITTLKLLRVKQDWEFDIHTFEVMMDYSQPAGMDRKAVYSKRKAPVLSSPYLAELVYFAALRGKLPVFKDPACKIPVDLLGYMDTIVSFDPATQAESIKSAFSELDPITQFTAWRLRQILVYHKKSATWTTTVEAIAPLVLDWERDYRERIMRPLFWFKPDDKPQKLTDNDIVWAKTTRNVQEHTQVSIDGGRVLKIADGFNNPLTHLLQVMKTDSKTPFYDAWNEQPLSTAERLAMLSKTDTVVTFNAQTYEEHIEIQHTELTADSIQQLRLLQTWYWDEERHRLSICLEGVGPVINYMHSSGNFSIPRVPFYRRGKR